MATITPTTGINPTTMAANWGPGVSANAQKWLNKYLNPKVAFNSNPTQAQAAWQAGVTAAMAANRYATKMAAVNLTTAANNASTFGVTNYAASGTNKAAKYAAKTQALAAAETTVRATVEAMPKGRGQNNINRMVAWANGMAAYKGQI
jgi:hypothetical protein